MMRSLLRRTALGLSLLVLGGARQASAQYFGRNKVQYEKFDFRVLKTDHFDLYFYPAESLVTRDAGRMAERWYARHSDTFRHQFERHSIVLYADHPDFEQTNVVGDSPDESTGGVTEGLRTRVVMPFTGSYADDDHVLGHELVHVFQYDIAENSEAAGLQRLNTLPLWLIEGMAEYFSLGRDNALTAMWMRDAVARNDFPTINQLTTDPRYFPYRYGQALWAYVAGRWGDRAVVDVYRAALRLGWDNALIRVLGENSDSLSKDWIAANKALYTQQVVGRTPPKDAGEPLLQSDRKNADMNLAPTISPDGKYVAFFSRRGLFTIDLYVADARTGRIIKKLVGPTADPHFDAITFINSSGAWSPDAKHFAFIVNEGGNNDIAILDVEGGNIERRIKVPSVGSVNSVAWSPDGRTLAFSGQDGGMSDLFLVDLASGKVTALTHDRFADLQPTFSPDGKTIAFTSDRGPSTNFQELRFSKLQLATISVNGGPVTVYSPFPNGKEINPQFTPDGQSVLFVSDQDGFSDIYRLNLASGAVTRVTKVTTGVSGITEISPAITVSPTTGRMLFTVFQDQGYAVYGLDAPQTMGTPIAATAEVTNYAILPPGDAPGARTVTSYLKDPLTGLVSGNDFKIEPYHSSFSLDALSQPSIGVASGPFGTGFAGGIAALFGDQLSDRQITAILQANGTVKDIGGALYYMNLKNRWNYGVGISHIPYLTGYTSLADTSVGNGIPALNYYQILQRLYVDQVSLNTQYPFSTTRRAEISLNGTRLGSDGEVDRITVLQNGQIVDENRSSLSSGIFPTVYYASADFALVGDNSYAAFVSPVSGSRWRLEASPTFGSISYTTALADYRRYFFMQPFTLAFRGLHFGRYGKDAENYSNGYTYPLYLGDETLVRGYGYGSFDPSECVANGNSNACPVLDRMFGSRIGVINAEFRIPLFGSSQFGLLNMPFLPTEIAPFFDAGIAYSSDQPASLRWASSANDIPASCAKVDQSQTLYAACVEHIPVFSTGVSARMNILGYMILETYIAHPFQRPGKNWVVGVQLAPGW
ncbi:MAG TPA: hypothetical protein VG818_05310 [Gemmatimonadaceae bacterium]|nr:hypothetical protein [Gemmatimonadaceae bacterium]